MNMKTVKRIILASSLVFAVISSAQAQTSCYVTPQGKQCYTHHSAYPYSPYPPYYYKPYHGATSYNNYKGMKTVCHYDNYGHKSCHNNCNGMYC